MPNKKPSVHALRRNRFSFRYFSENDMQPTGIWYGPGCADFGLEQGSTIEGEHFENMRHGLDPQGRQFTRDKPHHDDIAAIDLTFCAAASLSMLRASASEIERWKIDNIILEARKSAIGEMISKWNFTGGGRPIFAMFSHHYNRAQEPAEHLHCLLISAAKDKNGVGRRITSAHPLWSHRREFYEIMWNHETAAEKEYRIPEGQAGFGYGPGHRANFEKSRLEMAKRGFKIVGLHLR
jgi:conjugative relaxase-like TrwC/TraI family protein